MKTKIDIKRAYIPLPSTASDSDKLCILHHLFHLFIYVIQNISPSSLFPFPNTLRTGPGFMANHPPLKIWLMSKPSQILLNPQGLFLTVIHYTYNKNYSSCFSHVIPVTESENKKEKPRGEIQHGKVHKTLCLHTSMNTLKL